MSFDDFMKKKEAKQDSFETITDEILNVFLTGFRITETRYYLDSIKRCKGLTEKEIYDKFAGDQDLYHFLTNYVYKSDREINNRVKEKVETSCEYVVSAFKNKLKALLEIHTKSRVVQVSIRGYSSTANSANVLFIMENDNQLLLTLHCQTYRKENGKLFLKSIV